MKYTISGIYASVAPSYENIGYEPFYYYYSQDHYDVPEVVEIGGNEYTVTSLSRKAFSNYYNSDYKPNYYGSPLKTISFPSTLKTIEDMVFLNCWKLESIVIPENLGISVFVGCDALREIFYLPTTAPTNWTATSLTYVPSAEVYNKPTTKINDAQIIPMITFATSSFIYY